MSHHATAYLLERVAGTVGVLRVGPDGQLTPLRHRLHHSPSGMEWGYAGSGPADLARSMLADYLQDPDPHPALYQQFKHDLIAPLDQEARRHRIEGATIAAWLADQQEAQR